MASSTLKGNQRRYEYELLCRLREVLPAGVKVTVVADRGFGDCKLFYALTTELAFCDSVAWRHLRDLQSAPGGVRGGWWVLDTYELPVVVCVQDPKMDEPWCLVASERPDRVHVRHARFLRCMFRARTDGTACC